MRNTTNGKMENIRLSEVLSRSRNCTVYSCTNGNGTEMVLKKISIADKGIPLEELMCLTMFKNDNMVSALNIGESQESIYILQEMGLQDVANIDKKYIKPLDMLSDLTYALYDMHSNGCCHGDIKPSNIVLFKSGTFKLIDFGSVSFCRGKISTSTPRYRSYELWSTSKPTVYSDIWALGCTLFEVKYNKPLIKYRGKKFSSYIDDFNTIFSGSYICSNGMDREDTVDSIIIQCLAKNPQDRINIHQISHILGLHMPHREIIYSNIPNLPNKYMSVVRNVSDGLPNEVSTLAISLYSQINYRNKPKLRAIVCCWMAHKLVTGRKLDISNYRPTKKTIIGEETKICTENNFLFDLRIGKNCKHKVLNVAGQWR